MAQEFEEPKHLAIEGWDKAVGKRNLGNDIPIPPKPSSIQACLLGKGKIKSWVLDRSKGNQRWKRWGKRMSR